MTFIRWIEDEQATGDIGKLYDEWKQANPGRPRMPGILKCLSHSPVLLRGINDISYGLHFNAGFLTRRMKEMIATLVSGLNQCPY